MDDLLGVKDPPGGVARAARAGRRLILFAGVVDGSPLLGSLVALLERLVDPSRCGAGDDLWLAASALAGQVLKREPQGGTAGDSGGGAGAKSSWYGEVLERLLTDTNPFTRAAARNPEYRRIPASLRAAAAHDLRCLRALATLSGSDLEAALRAREPEWPARVLAESGGHLRPGIDGAPYPWPEGIQRVVRLLEASDDWAEVLPELAAYWHAAGTGAYGRYPTFRWGVRQLGAGAELLPVEHLDPTRLEDLVGYEDARQAVVENTERLVSGRPAHHLLLYGPRGTGKSATVRALIHTFAVRGLRLVEFPLNRVDELPRLLGLLREEPQWFVILLDDLSLEPGDPAARALKVALEGTLEAWPENVRLYATSNRRHLVREVRNGNGPAFRPQDEIHEQISLADRFGVTVLFQAADQELYLRIVEGLLRRYGVRITAGDAETGTAAEAAPGGPSSGPAAAARALDRPVMVREALQWALWNNERSPRSAAQFVREWLGREREEGVNGPRWQDSRVTPSNT